MESEKNCPAWAQVQGKMKQENKSKRFSSRSDSNLTVQQ